MYKYLIFIQCPVYKIKRVILGTQGNNKESTNVHCLINLLPEADSSAQWRQPSPHGVLGAAGVSLQ